MAISVRQFVKYLNRSGVMSAEEVTAFLETLSSPPQDGQALAKKLIKAGKITTFQAQRIYQGKYQGLLLGDYLIVDAIGAGGMGQVYLAEHRRMGRKVALKTLPEKVAQDKQTVQRFHREVRAAAKLTHPNIVAAFDAGEDQGVHYFVMEHVEGEDLSRLVRRNGRLKVDQAVDFILQAAAGLCYAHNEGIVHRDIKPSNMLVDLKGTVKILDMGLARIESEADQQSMSALTQTGAVMGTIDYMAPEQAIDTKHADARSDIYSLGCTLFFLLTGRTAYRGSTMAQKLFSHRDDPIPDLAGERSDVPAWLSSVFTKMMAKLPDDRFQSMQEVIDALKSNEVVEAHRGTSGQPVDPQLQSFLHGLDVAETPTVVQPTDSPRKTTSESTTQADIETVPSGILDATLVGGIGERSPESNRSITQYVNSWWIGGGIVCLLGIVAAGLFFISDGQETGAPKVLSKQSLTDESQAKSNELPVLTGEAAVNSTIDWLFRIGAEVYVDGHPTAVNSFTEYKRLGRPIFFVGLHDLFEVNDENITQLTHLQSLTTLEMSNLSISDEGFERLSSLPGITGVNLSRMKIGPKTVATLLGWSGLANLELRDPMFIQPVTHDSFVKEVSNASSLRYLFLPGMSYSKEALESLKTISTLTSLNIDGCSAVDDDAGKLLSDFPALEGLYARGCQLTDRFIESISTSSIESLVIGENALTQASIPFLERMTSLKEIDLSGTSMTKQDIHELATKMSKCHIISSFGEFNIDGNPSFRATSNAAVGYALQFDGIDDYVEIPSLEYDYSQPFTIEVRCRPREDKTDPSVNFDPVFASSRNNFQHPSQSVLSVIFDRRNSAWWTNSSFLSSDELYSQSIPQSVSLQSWKKGPTSLAVQWDERTLKLYLNGELKQECSKTVVKPNPREFPRFSTCICKAFSIEASEYRHFGGIVDEFRFSTIARYGERYSPESSYVSDENTLALYHFDERNGDVLIDASGNGHHGKIHGSQRVEIDPELSVISRIPIQNYGLQFDGDDHIEFPDWEFDFSEPITIEARIRPETNPEYGPITVIANEAKALDLWVGYKEIAVSFHDAESGKHIQTFKEFANVPDEPINLVVTFDNKWPKLFVNGEESTSRRDLTQSKPAAQPYSNGHLFIGRWIADDQRISAGFQGIIDAIRISTGDKSSVDLSVPIDFSPDENTLALFNFNEGTGESVVDLSGNEVHGTVYGANWVRVDEKLNVIDASHSLKFDGVDDYVELAGLEEIPPPLTFEAWVKVSRADKGHIIWTGAPTWQTLEVQDGHWQFAVVHPDQTTTIIQSKEKAKLEQWTHVAATWDGETAHLFVDGQDDSVPKGVQGFHWPEVRVSRISGNVNDETNFAGELGEVRISKSIKYQDDFVPQHNLDREDDTLALYAFENGKGDKLNDSSENKYDGIVHGAQCVVAQDKNVDASNEESKPGSGVSTSLATPVIQIGPDQQMVKSLGEAFQQAAGNSVIEICQNEPLEIDASKVVWSKPGDLVIRAGPGFTPILVSKTPEQDQQLISIGPSDNVEDSVVFRGLTFLNLKHAGNQCLIGTHRVTHCDKCLFVSQSSVITSGANDPKPISFTDCYFWRSQILSRNRPTAGSYGNWSLKNCLFGGTGYLYTARSNSYETVLENCTFLHTRNVFTIPGETSIRSRNNVFVGLDSIVQFYPLDDGDTAKAKSWLTNYEGKNNLYYECDRFAPQLPKDNQRGDLAVWQAFTNDGEKNLIREPPKFVHPQPVINAEQHFYPPSAFQLRSNSKGKSPTVGCEVSKLPEVPEMLLKILPDQIRPPNF